MAEIKYVIKLPPITKKNSQQIMTNKATGRPFIMPSQNTGSTNESLPGT